ncbi:MAG: 3-deoxy-7-phosphoheptulonate synthase [Gammaproteobacteria bacterium RIFCSPHIGHO2_12_FULL_41_15]|nr:MAG: 3-deoxy-7-phosphoheptulonate synthase [Gammaproteobacteria bacterium RIFCSPHIGHO2_12_FULL_41_15]
MTTTDNIRVTKLNALIAPTLLVEQLPVDDLTSDHIARARQEISQALHGKDDRLIVIVGPCSIHDPEAAIEYANHIKRILPQYEKDLIIIMRVYFEKPRTTVGWKGLINDPYLDNSFNINHGLSIARELLLKINRLGVATGSEFLDTVIPQYISDLTSWSAIGARTSESQIHRELASGLSMPVGFKNTTTGSIQIAADAVCAASYPHHFLGISKQGVAAIVNTTGNKDCHIILRGSSEGPNYDRKSIQVAVEILKQAKLNPQLMVDLSHGNSNKDYQRQKVVAQDIAKQLSSGNMNIMGVMIESNLKEGHQKLEKGRPLVYGQSITDACISFEDTLSLLDLLGKAVRERRNHRG